MATVDSLLLLGSKDEKLGLFLTKMGYSVLRHDGNRPLPEFLARTFVDCIIVDSRCDMDCAALCEFLRSEETTRTVPIVYMAQDQLQRAAIEQGRYDRLEVVDAPFTIGKLASRIAVQLRLRKIAGVTEQGASMGDMLAAQREITEHIRKEIQEAKDIQRNLLPRVLPSDPRYEISANYQPLEQVGGDWFYAEKEPDGRLALQVADVTGHGLAAAFIGSMTKLALYAVPGETPHERLCGVNRLMTPQLPEGRFVTMNFVLYDPESGKLQLARAGHPPGLVLNRARGVVDMLQPDGYAVGFFEDSKYASAEAALAPGDVAMIFTDGISEAQDRQGRCYGLARLSHVLLSSAADADAEQILCAIIDDFQKFLDGRVLKDDVTMVLVRRVR